MLTFLKIQTAFYGSPGDYPTPFLLLSRWILLYLFLYNDHQKSFHVVLQTSSLWEGNLGSQSSSVVEWLCSADRPGFAHQPFETKDKAKQHMLCIVSVSVIKRGSGQGSDPILILHLLSLSWMCVSFCKGKPLASAQGQGTILPPWHGVGLVSPRLTKTPHSRS